MDSETHSGVADSDGRPPATQVDLYFSNEKTQNFVGTDFILCKTGGPGVEVASFAWRVALNFSQEPRFAGFEKYDILGERLAVNL